MPKKTLKPLPDAYPNEITTIGDHLRTRRLDLGLYQRDVAKQVGVITDTITNWELGRTEPGIQHVPAIIDFLGYVPFPLGETFPERVKAYRMIKGLSQRAMAQELGIDPTTLSKWELGESTPSRKLKRRLEDVLRDRLSIRKEMPRNILSRKNKD